MPKEAVNNPNHYSPNGRDTFMHLKDQMGAEAFNGFLQGNVIKYTSRHQFKDKPVEDLNKAIFYLLHLYFERGGTGGQLLKTVDHTADHYGRDRFVKKRPASDVTLHDIVFGRLADDNKKTDAHTTDAALDASGSAEDPGNAEDRECVPTYDPSKHYKPGDLVRNSRGEAIRYDTTVAYAAERGAR